MADGQNTKSVLESKTFWGLVLALGVPIAAKHGIIIDPHGLAGDMSTLVGGVLALYGRWTASGGIRLL